MQRQVPAMCNRRLAAWATVCWLLSVPGIAVACAPHVEESPRWASARFRAHTDAFEPCPVSETTYRQVVAEWLRERAPDATDLESFGLGRLVGYPWISRYLADAALRSPGWAERVARTRPGEFHALAAPLLGDPGLRARLAVPFEASRYEVVGVSFEKVLYGPAAEHASGPDAGAVLVPFDAQFWLTLAPRR